MSGKARHGRWGTPEYVAWDSMLQRCLNSKSKAFKKYGAAGRTVCLRWWTFEHFFEDLGPRPPGTSLHRIDNTQGYFPGNCKWATKLEQQNALSTNRVLEFQGESKTMAEWSRSTGLKYVTLQRRLLLGWTVERALTEKLNEKFSH